MFAVPRRSLHGSVELRVTYPGGVAVAPGAQLSRAATAAKPDVMLVGADAGSSYTLLMVDPDAPDPNSPTFRSWLHWLVVDVPGASGGPAAGRTLTQYKGPSPPAGTHRCARSSAMRTHVVVCRICWRRRLLTWPACARRYIFLLFQQPAPVGAAHAAQLAPPERNSFNVRTFAAANKLQGPVGVNFFLASKAQ